MQLFLFLSSLITHCRHFFLSSTPTEAMMVMMEVKMTRMRRMMIMIMMTMMMPDDDGRWVRGLCEMCQGVWVWLGMGTQQR